MTAADDLLPVRPGSITFATAKWLVGIFTAIAGVWASNSAQQAKTETRVDGLEKRFDRFETKLDSIYVELRARP